MTSVISLPLYLSLLQVFALGCNSFAILFDDIDPDMCPADDKMFSSFAHAQVAITNELYCHLDRPGVFLFCPTGNPSLSLSLFFSAYTSPDPSFS